MRILALQHVPFEPPGAVAAWAAERGHDFRTARVWEGAPGEPAGADGPLPDMLVVMGGPMGVGDEDAHPWLAPEKRLIAAAVGAGRLVLGVCLGAQLLADVLGAPVSRNPEPEIGWFSVRPTREASGSPLFGPMPAEFVALHWHGDTFGIPAGAARMAESDACANQAFEYGDRCVGLQFHLEAGADEVRALSGACGGELAGGGRWVRSALDLAAGAEEHGEADRALLFGLLDRLAAVGPARA